MVLYGRPRSVPLLRLERGLQKVMKAMKEQWAAVDSTSLHGSMSIRMKFKMNPTVDKSQETKDFSLQFNCRGTVSPPAHS